LAAELLDKINKLKKERNAVILAHNYQRDDVQDLADYVGDSLGLSISASKTAADVIVFCGVHFMAETAAIISPNKTVLIPDDHAGCPMADMINVEKLNKLKKEHPGAPVVCYVNSSAEVKAGSDICCTSANAISVVESLPDKEIIFIPDKFLGMYVQSKVKDKKMILFDGYCPTHAKILPEHIRAVKAKHPRAEVLVHPECRPETIAMADAALSTDGMLKYVKNSNSNEFIIGTEVGIIHRLKKENHQKVFYSVSDIAVCPNMKLITLEKILWSLEDMQHVIKVPEEISNKAKIAIEKMLKVNRRD